MQQPSYYSIIPANVRYDKNLKDSHKVLYSEITALANKNGYCSASNTYFSELYGVDKVTISRRINKLIKLGYLKSVIEKKDKQVIARKLYPVTEPVNKNDNTPINNSVNTYSQNCKGGINKNVKTPINRNVKENNTSNNNTSNNIYCSSDDKPATNLKQEIEKEFEALWKLYPKKTGKKAALNHYRAWRKTPGHTYTHMLIKLQKYLQYLKIKQTPLEYTLNGSTWFNGRFDDDLDLTPRQLNYQQPRRVRQTTNWSEVEARNKTDSHSQMTDEEMNSIFQEFGKSGGA